MSINKLLLSFMFFALLVTQSFAKIFTYTIPSSGSYTEAQIISGLNTACSTGDCVGGQSTDDILYLVIPTGVNVRVAPDEADWDLLTYSKIIIDIQGTGTLTVPKKSEILLSAVSSVTIASTANLIAENNGNTYLKIGTTDYHGAAFPGIVTAGGASQSGTGTTPPTFGTNEWIVSGYSGITFTTFKGAYTEPLLSFDTRNRWSSGSNPSSASGYSGTTITNDNHSYAYRRQGFSCGNYTIGVTGHDDNAWLYVDGNLVWSHAGYGDVHNDAWTGFLNATSTVEFRVYDTGGNSYGALQFTQNNTDKGINKFISQACGGGAQTITISGISGTSWSPATGLNTTTGNTVIANPTNATTYTVTGTSDCDGSAYSDQISVHTNPANDFGLNEWKVFGYSDQTFTTYAGFYTESNLSFDTRNRWSNSPSDANSYVGCTIGNDNHSYAHKREGFPCGNYTINITTHDDDIEVIVDGKSRFTHAGCCDAHSNIWTGFLGPNSKVEIRTKEGSGSSNTAINFVQNNTTPGLNTTRDFDCTTNAHTLNVIGMSSVTWTPTTNLNTTTGNTVIATPTQGTIYTANGLSLCDGSPLSATFNVLANPSVDFPKDEWAVLCYDDGNFNNYRGFYTVSTLSFNTRDYWQQYSNPGTATDYAGCSVPGDNHSYIHKREGFPCGTYRIDLVAHDDGTTVYVDGKSVYTRTGWTGTAVSNIWTGFLGPNSQVEIKTSEGGGASNAAFNLTQLNSLAGNNSFQDFNCSTGEHTLKVVGLSGVTWTPTTNLNTAAGNTVIATPTVATQYIASGTSLCDASPMSLVFDVPANPTTDFGSNKWAVFCYNGRTFDTYRGFYTVSTTSFDTRDYWATNANPSQASNYLGCSVNGNDHSYRHKREGFPCGNYTINLVAHDDECNLYVDGILKYSKTGTSGAVANIWTGFLGPNSTVEIETGEGGGASYTAFDFVQNNSLAGINKTQEFDCNTGINTLKVIGLTGVIWTPTTGLNTSSGNTVIATPTELTTYTAAGTSLCDGSALSAQFDVNGNPDTDFGNNKWVVFAYDGQTFDTYKGFYTISTLSFDTRDSWANNSNPGNASNYVGCSVPGNYHSYKHKREGFNCGNYQINLVAHDDNCSVIIDGVTVYNRANSSGASSNIWTGFLGPNSQVEIRTGEIGGNSYTAFNFIYLNSGGPASGQKVWNGLVDNDWFNDGNWCPSAPTAATDNILISANAPNYPVITSNSVSFTDIQFKTGAAFTVANGFTVDVLGNWNDEGNIATIDGTIRFAGTTPQTITGNNATFKNVTINNSAGVIISGAVRVDGLLTLTNGLVTTTASDLITITQNGSITAGGTSNYINGPLAKEGATNFIFPVGNAGRYSPIEVQDITSSSTFRAQYFKTAYANTASLNVSLNNVSGLEHWLLDRTAGTGAAKVGLYWFDAAKSGIDNLTDLQVAHFNGTEWVTEGQSATTGDLSNSGSIVSNNVIPSFSPFTFGSLSPTSNPLPVELIVFKGKMKGNNVVLEWATAQEKNNDFFSIERSVDGANFESIGTIVGAGNSSTLVEYSFADHRLDEEGYYYRLKQVDYDGEYAYSDIVFVSTLATQDTQEVNISIYPNPKNSSATLYVLLDNAEGKITVEITNLKGGLIASQEYQVTEGDENVIVTFTDEIPRGVYLVKATGNSISKIARLVVE